MERKHHPAAEAVRRERLALGWTQEHLAELLKVRQSYIANLEAGRIGTPVLGTCLILRDHLGIPLELWLEEAA